MNLCFNDRILTREFYIGDFSQPHYIFICRDQDGQRYFLGSIFSAGIMNVCFKISTDEIEDILTNKMTMLHLYAGKQFYFLHWQSNYCKYKVYTLELKDIPKEFWPDNSFLFSRRDFSEYINKIRK